MLLCQDPGFQAQAGCTGVVAVLVWWWKPARVPAMLQSGQGG